MDENSKNIPLNPWFPMNKSIDLKHLDKLLEETGELTSAAARCLAQGIDEREPVTGKLNREWLEDEIADVCANLELNIEHFNLNRERIASRIDFKKKHLKRWHGMLNDAS